MIDSLSFNLILYYYYYYYYPLGSNTTIILLILFFFINFYYLLLFIKLIININNILLLKFFILLLIYTLFTKCFVRVQIKRLCSEQYNSCNSKRMRYPLKAANGGIHTTNLYEKEEKEQEN